MGVSLLLPFFFHFIIHLLCSVQSCPVQHSILLYSFLINCRAAPLLLPGRPSSLAVVRPARLLCVLHVIWLICHLFFNFYNGVPRPRDFFFCFCFVRLPACLLLFASSQPHRLLANIASSALIFTLVPVTHLRPLMLLRLAKSVLKQQQQHMSKNWDHE